MNRFFSQRFTFGCLWVAAVELDARRMRAYGTVSPADEKLFDQIFSELQEKIRSLDRCLGGNGEDDSPPELP